MTSIRVRITGKVQGVGYRAWTQENAQARGIDGWVRNRRDGSVEAAFGGTAAATGAMLAACSEGPPAAQVAEIQTLAEGEQVEPGFEIRDTV